MKFIFINIYLYIIYIYKYIFLWYKMTELNVVFCWNIITLALKLFVLSTKARSGTFREILFFRLEKLKRI
jgi:hypothetical protein